MTHTIEGLKADGWRELSSSGFNTAVGQVLFRNDHGATQGGFIASDRIGNDNDGGDVVHGGASMTFADIVLGLAAGRAAGTPYCVTVQMTYQFVAAARFGDFVTCRAEVLRVTSSLVFARGLIRAGERDVGSVDALFKPIRTDSPPR